MTTKEQSDQTLAIHMFGVFWSARNGEVFTDKLKRSRQLEGLMKYLLAYRGCFAAPDELVEALWEGRSCDNPAKAIQNLVYRLRMMIDIEGKPSHILFVNGGYGWNTQSDYVLDIERFDELYDQAMANQRNGAPSPDLFKAALDLYSADFLSNTQYDLWTVSLRQTYRQKFTSAVETLLSYYKNNNLHHDVIALCEKAMAIDPYDEKVHVTFLRSLMATNRVAHARMHYSYITELLYRDLGVSPSAELKEAYALINGNGKFVQHDMDSILRTFSDDRGIDGPYFCDEEVFHELFKLERRRLQRSGQSNCLLLLTISNTNYSVPAPESLKNARNSLKLVLASSLRKGDVVCVWNDMQMLVLLVSLTFEDAEMISQRIIARFNKSTQGASLLLQKKISPIRSEAV